MSLYESFLYIDQYVGEGTHWLYTTTLTDKAGIAIGSAQLATLTLTLINVAVTPHTIVNAVNQVNINNEGRGVISVPGILSLTLSGADTAVIDSTHAMEQRRARLEWTKTGSLDVLWREIDFIVKRKTVHSV